MSQNPGELIIVVVSHPFRAYNDDFRAELAQIKLEEETRESDLTLLSHLDRKLGSLKQEQTDLIEASYDLKVIYRCGSSYKICQNIFRQV